MYTARSIVLSVVIGCMGIVQGRLRQAKMLVELSCRTPQRPIMDPDDGSGPSFEEDKARLDRFAKEMQENTSAEAYIIAFAGLVSYKNEAKIRLNCIREYLKAAHGISRPD